MVKKIFQNPTLNFLLVNMTPQFSFVALSRYRVVALSPRYPLVIMIFIPVFNISLWTFFYTGSLYIPLDIFFIHVSYSIIRQL
jgi:hypothetical protein